MSQHSCSHWNGEKCPECFGVRCSLCKEPIPGVFPDASVVSCTCAERSRRKADELLADIVKANQALLGAAHEQ